MEKTAVKMNINQLKRWRFNLTLIVVLAEVAFLIWEHANGGIKTHHILQRADLPGISNWWGLICLPALAWFLLGHVQARLIPHVEDQKRTAKFIAILVAGFVGALLMGVFLSIAFMRGDEDTAAVVLLAILLLALLLPAYRAEYLLGFVSGMNFTFGPILPILIGTVIVAISAMMHLLVYAGLVRAWHWLTRRPNT